MMPVKRLRLIPGGMIVFPHSWRYDLPKNLSMPKVKRINIVIEGALKKGNTFIKEIPFKNYLSSFFRTVKKNEGLKFRYKPSFII